MTLLEVSNLETRFDTQEGSVEAVNNVDLTIEHGETVGLVGESGSGKSVTALSIMGLVDAPGKITGGTVNLKGEDLLEASDSRLENIRGDEMSMIFQDPMESLNPVLQVGDQISETLRSHDVIPTEGIDYLERSLIGNFVPRRSVSKRYPKSWKQAVDLMNEVGIPDPEQRAKDYPHQFSGGMQQRAMIASALAGNPDLLIADEPTTALDVTIQAQILNLLDRLQEENDMGILLITHDLGVVNEMCDRVAVMYAGQIVETGPVDEIFMNPKHPYTRGLLRSTPRATEEVETLQPIGGQVPELIDLPDACYFASRCEHAHDACYDGSPQMYQTEENLTHQARCVLYDESNPRRIDEVAEDLHVSPQSTPGSRSEAWGNPDE